MIFDRRYGDGYIMIGFSEGYAVAISTHMEEIGEELQCLKVHDTGLSALAYSETANKFASCGEFQVKVVDTSVDWKTEVRQEVVHFTMAADGKPDKLAWTTDGKILTVATSNGTLFCYLMSLPVLSAAYLHKMVYLSSLREVTVSNAALLVGTSLTVNPGMRAIAIAIVIAVAIAITGVGWNAYRVW